MTAAPPPPRGALHRPTGHAEPRSRGDQLPRGWRRRLLVSTNGPIPRGGRREVPRGNAEGGCSPILGLTGRPRMRYNSRHGRRRVFTHRRRRSRRQALSFAAIRY
eukprot:363549-Chlamydomonas_euryale.AAC.6